MESKIEDIEAFCTSLENNIKLRKEKLDSFCHQPRKVILNHKIVTPTLANITGVADHIERAKSIKEIHATQEIIDQHSHGSINRLYIHHK